MRRTNKHFPSLTALIFLSVCLIWLIPDMSYGIELNSPNLNLSIPNKLTQTIEKCNGILLQISELTVFAQESKPPPPPPRKKQSNAEEGETEEKKAEEKATPSQKPPPKKGTVSESSSEGKTPEKEKGFFQNIIDKIKSIFGMGEKKEDRTPIPRRTKPKVSIKKPGSTPPDSVKKETDTPKKETPPPPKEAKKSEKEPEKTERESPKPPPPEVKKAEAQKTPPPPPKEKPEKSEPETKPTAEVAETETAETDTEKNYEYERSGRRDPFRSLLETEQKETTQKKLDIQSLKLVGIIDFGDSGLKAMFEDKDGEPYLLQEGDPVTDGKVVEVNKQEVVFEVVDIGNQTRKIKIPLEENQEVGE